MANPNFLPLFASTGNVTLGSAANVELLDSNEDGNVNVWDAVGIFGFLFGGVPPPLLELECVPISGCATNCAQ